MAAPNPNPNPEHRPVIVLDEWEESQLARAILVQDRNGTVHEIPPPELWPDGLTTAATEGDLEAAGPLLLGVDGYKSWVEGGGSATKLFALIGQKFNMSPGESPASST